MASKTYTAQELREAAVSPTYIGGVSEVRVKPEVYEMLEQAADMVERCDNVLKANARELEYRHKDADAALAYANYILRGDAGNDNENK